MNKDQNQYVYKVTHAANAGRLSQTQTYSISDLVIAPNLATAWNLWAAAGHRDGKPHRLVLLQSDATWGAGVWSIERLGQLTPIAAAANKTCSKRHKTA